MRFNLDVHYSNDNEQVIYEVEIKIHYGRTIFFNITITVCFGYFKRESDFLSQIFIFRGSSFVLNFSILNDLLYVLNL